MAESALHVMQRKRVSVNKTKREIRMFKTREEIEELIIQSKKELAELRAAPEVSRGVYKLGDKFVVKAGALKLGEYETEKEAATAHNEYVQKTFNFPIYNNKGTVPQQEENVEVETNVEETKKLIHIE